MATGSSYLPSSSPTSSTFNVNFPSSYSPLARSSGLLLPSEYDELNQPPIETLPFEEIVRNKHVKKLFRDYQEANSQLLSSNKMIQSLLEENRKLRSQCEANLSRGIHSPYPRSISIASSSSCTTSLAPSDSISQAPHAPTMPQIIPVRGTEDRPDDLPVGVLWTLKDCANDEILSPSMKSNPSRPLMQFALRERDGSLISQEKYKAIKDDVIALCNSNLHVLEPPSEAKRRRGSKLVQGTMTWYKTHFKVVWNSVVSELERMHPVLRLCAGHWKAEHMLSRHLTSKVGTKHAADDEDEMVTPRTRPQSSAPATLLASPPPAAPSPPPAALQQISSQSHSPSPPPTPSRSKRTRTDSQNENSAKRLRPDSSEVEDEIADVFGLQSQSKAAQKSTPPPPIIDISGIQVNSSLENLKTALASDFPSIKTGVQLIERLQQMSSATASSSADSEPSASLLTLIQRIETADPNDPSLEEDDTNESWGHRQFTAGDLQLGTALGSWGDVGSVNTASRLIAATIRMCRVARYLCTQRQIIANSFVCDAYLDRVVETLWNITPTPPSDPPGGNSASTSASGPDLSSRDGILSALQNLTVEQMKAWMSRNNIVCTVKQPKKSHYIETITASDTIPSADEMKAMLAVRRSKGKKGTS
ncbi:hypothetical protein CC2G_013238 [Coprinopsis cinerea AmutBmut pab1-1]|nr:hypothetical protein CC2G_013238 [Coprinopsis cinerea AmutBmut pab1-1]